MSDRQQNLGRKRFIQTIGTVIGVSVAEVTTGIPSQALAKGLSTAESAFRSPVFDKPIKRNPDNSWTVTDTKEIITFELIPPQLQRDPQNNKVHVRQSPNQYDDKNLQALRPTPETIYHGYRVAGYGYAYDANNNPDKLNIGGLIIKHEDVEYPAGLWIRLTDPEGNDQQPSKPRYVAGLSANVIPTPPTAKMPQK